jgi:hypothetical protein
MRNHRLTAFTLFVSFALGAPVALAADTTASQRATSHSPVVKKRPQIPQFPADVKARGDRLWNAASPAVKSWASQNAAGIARGTGEAEALARAAVQARWSHVRAAGASDTLIFMANYEAAKTLQADLEKDLDSRSEMGGDGVVALQERLNKMMTVLSNMMKKLSDTADSIVGNMK